MQTGPNRPRQAALMPQLRPLLLGAAAVLLSPALALAGPTTSDPLAQPLTKEDLQPTYLAIIECARRNEEPGCLAARNLADQLLDRPYVTSICKDTAFEVTLKATATSNNSFDRKELLVNKANDILLLCRAREDPKPVSNTIGDGDGIKER